MTGSTYGTPPRRSCGPPPIAVAIEAGGGVPSYVTLTESPTATSCINPVDCAPFAAIAISPGASGVRAARPAAARRTVYAPGLARGESTISVAPYAWSGASWAVNSVSGVDADQSFSELIVSAAP